MSLSNTFQHWLDHKRKLSLAFLRGCSFFPLLLFFLSSQTSSAGPEALPNVQLRGRGDVKACVRLNDGTMVIAGLFSSVDGVAASKLVRLDAGGAVMTSWTPGMPGNAECLTENGEYLYVAGYKNSMEMSGGRYGAVRRIRIADGHLDPVFSLSMEARVDRMFLAEGWLFVNGSWEGNDIRAYWLGPAPAPLNPLYWGSGRFTDSLRWSDVYAGRLWIFAAYPRALSSLPFPAIEGDGGVVFRQESSATSMTRDGDILWVLAGRNIKGIHLTGPEPDILLPVPSSVTGGQIYLGKVSGEFWISPWPTANEWESKPTLFHRSADGIWSDVGTGVFGNRTGAIRGVLAEPDGTLAFGSYSVPSGGAGLVKMRPEGDLLRSWNCLRDWARIRAVEFLPEGGAVAGGDFEEVDGLSLRGIFRLKPDWTLDRNWLPTCDGPVETLDVNGDRVLAGGWFITRDAAASRYLASFPLNGQGLADPAFGQWNRGPVYSVRSNGDSIHALSQADDLPATPVNKAVITKSVATPGRINEQWSSGGSWYVSQKYQISVAAGKIFCQGSHVLRESDGVPEDAYFSDAVVTIDDSGSVFALASGFRVPGNGNRYALGDRPLIAADPIWLSTGGQRNVAFTPLTASGRWVYGNSENSVLERRSLYGSGEPDSEAFLGTLHTELIRVRSREMLVSGTAYVQSGTGQFALGRYLLPAERPAQQITSFSLPARAIAGSLVPVTAATDVGNPVMFACSGDSVAGPDGSSLMILQPGTFTVRAYQNGTTHEPAVEQDRNITVSSGRSLRFSTGKYLRIPSFGTADPWPDVLPVRGFSGPATSLSVVLEGVYHKSPHDLQIVLENPAGKRLVLLNRNGSTVDAMGFKLVFNDAGGILSKEALAATIYRPVGGPPDPPLPPPLVSGTWESSLAALLTDSPDGDWKLYAYDEDEDGHPAVSMGPWSLLIGTTALTYESWIAQYFPQPSPESAMTADPDADGIPNLAEYALGTPPADPLPGTSPWSGNGAAPALVLTDPSGAPGHFLQYARRRDTGVTFRAEFSSDLTTWHTANNETMSPIDDDWEQVTAALPPVAAGSSFARLRVTADSP